MGDYRSASQSRSASDKGMIRLSDFDLPVSVLLLLEGRCRASLAVRLVRECSIPLCLREVTVNLQAGSRAVWSAKAAPVLLNFTIGGKAQQTDEVWAA